MNREEMLERIIAQIKTMNRAQLEGVNMFLDMLEKEYKPEPAAQKTEYPDMVTNPEFYYEMLMKQK